MREDAELCKALSFSILIRLYASLWARMCHSPRNTWDTAKTESERKQNASGPATTGGLKRSWQYLKLISQVKYTNCGTLHYLLQKTRWENLSPKDDLSLERVSVSRITLLSVEEPPSISCGFVKKVVSRVLAFALSQVNSTWQVLLSQCRSPLVLDETGREKRKVVMTLQKQQWALIWNPQLYIP